MGTATPTPHRITALLRSRTATHTARHVATLTAVLVLSPVPSMLAPSHNYTWSLLIFVLPIATILYWFALSHERELTPSRRAFNITLALLIPMGILLNLLFADNFFVYPNTDAVIGWSVPALDFFAIDWQHPIPLEEFAFYISGFIAILLIYIWGDESFLRRYNIPDYAGKAAAVGAIVRLAWRPAVIALLMVGGGWALKSWLGEPGFPGYLAYLLLVPFVVTVTLYDVAAPFINWRAFMLVLLIIVADSLAWEVTLASTLR